MELNVTSNNKSAVYDVTVRNCTLKSEKSKANGFKTLNVDDTINTCLKLKGTKLKFIIFCLIQTQPQNKLHFCY